MLCCSRCLKTIKLSFTGSVHKGRRPKGGQVVAFPREAIVFCSYFVVLLFCDVLVDVPILVAQGH